MASEDSVLMLARGPKQTCEIAFYVGLRAELDGRMKDAATWYRVVMATASLHDGEYLWAKQRAARG